MTITSETFRSRAGVLCLAVLTLTTRTFAADTGVEWKVQVEGVRVVAIAPGSKDIEWALQGGAPGVTVVLMLTTPGGRIVGINTDTSKIDSFTDDQGADLMAGHTRGSRINDSRISTRPGFGPTFDGKPSEWVKVTAPNQPTKGATRFNIMGNVTVQTASQTNQFTAENVELRSGTNLSLGKLQLLICNVRSKDGENDVSLQSKQDLSSVASLDFYDEQGNKIESRVYSSYLNTSGAEKQWTLGFKLKTIQAKVKIVAACWTDLKTVEVPIAVKTGVGL